MSDEVVRIDNINLATLIKKELEKKGIKKDGINWINEILEFQNFKKEELEQIKDLEIINTRIDEIDELEKLPNLRNLKISSVNMRTMIKAKMMMPEDRYNYELKLSGIKDFSAIDNEENLRKINTENLKNLVSLKLRDNPNLKEVRGLDFNEELSELDLEHNRRR